MVNITMNCPDSKYKDGNGFGRPFCLDGEYTCDAGACEWLCKLCWRENEVEHGRENKD